MPVIVGANSSLGGASEPDWFWLLMSCFRPAPLWSPQRRTRNWGRGEGLLKAQSLSLSTLVMSSSLFFGFARKASTKLRESGSFQRIHQQSLS